MNNRVLHQPDGSLEQRVTEMFGSVTFGATGAVGSTTGKGVSSVTRTGTGQYKIALSDPMRNFFGFVGTSEDTGTPDSATVGTQFRIESKDTNSESDPHVIVQFHRADGADADPNNGSTWHWRMVGSISTV